MRYIIKHIKKTDETQAVLFIAHDAEIADTPEQAAAQFIEKRPDRKVYAVHEATEADKIALGLGYMTDGERTDYQRGIHATLERQNEELEEIRARLSEYSPEEFAANVEYEERRKTEETQNAEGVHLGDIFYTCWGYEQTNIDFYQVVQLKGKHTIVLRQNEVKRGCAHTYNGLTRPIRDVFKTGRRGEPYTVRTKFIDYHKNGNNELYVCVEGHSLDYAEFGKLYDYSCGA